MSSLLTFLRDKRLSLRKRVKKETNTNDCDIGHLQSLLDQKLTDFCQDASALDNEQANRLSEKLLFLAKAISFHSFERQAEAFDRAEKFGAHFLPVHFYSPIPSREEIGISTADTDYSRIPNLNPDSGTVSRLLDTYCRFSGELTDISESPLETMDFYWSNPAFNALDAIGLYSILRDKRPQRYVEIGCGYSSIIALKALEANGTGKMLCIEPYENEMLGSIQENTRYVEVINEPIQIVDTSVFSDLNSGDVLFIDSTHVSKFGSDVNFEFFQIIPFLNPGVLIHIHDIHYPLDYPIGWVRDRKVFWNEQYLLMAFLSFNSSFKPIISHSQCGANNRDKLNEIGHVVGRQVAGGGSFWFQRTN